MSYRYDSFTDRFIHIDDEQPNVAVGTPQMPIIVKEVDLTEKSIERIAEIVAKKLKETCNKDAVDAVNASLVD